MEKAHNHQLHQAPEDSLLDAKITAGVIEKV